MIESWLPIAVPAAIGSAATISTHFLTSVISRVFADRDAKRSKLNSDLEFLERTIFETRDAAKNYWAEDGDDAAVSSSIVGRLAFIGEYIGENRKIWQDGEKLINDFDDCCTSGDFQSHRKKAELRRATEIEVSAYKLVLAVRRARQR